MSILDEFDAIHGHLLADAKRQPEYANNQVSGLYGYSEGAEHALDVIRLKGYRKPRVITTVKELDGLPFGSIVLDDNGDAELKVSASQGWLELRRDGAMEDSVNLPATVLYEPEES